MFGSSFQRTGSHNRKGRRAKGGFTRRFLGSFY